METIYPELRTIHIAAVWTSGALFLLRTVALNVLNAQWPLTRPMRRLSYVIDTILLSAAVLLTTIIGQYPFTNGWLTMKVVLLLVYIVLGWFALRAVKRSHRLGFTILAAATFLLIVGVARAHHPLGVLA